MAKQVFKIEGGAELDAALIGLAEEFKPSNARNVLRGALRDGGQIIADAGEALAPRLTGYLAESYTVGGKLSRSQRKSNVKESQIEVYVGPTPRAESVQTEFGNAHQSAQPHLRPAWDGNWPKALDLIISRGKDRVEATRKRLARKAERLAAKMKA